MRRHVKRFLVAAILSSVLVPGPASVSAAPADCSEAIETFDVRAEARRPSYRIGETALVDVWVTDKVTGFPEANIMSGVILEPKHKKKVVYDVDYTSSEGHVLLRLELKDDGRVKPGKTKASAIAHERLDNPVYCGSRYGYSEYDNLFRIRR